MTASVDGVSLMWARQRGSPGAGKPHAGKCGELTPPRQRGGDGGHNTIPLPTGRVDSYRKLDIIEIGLKCLFGFGKGYK